MKHCKQWRDIVLHPHPAQLPATDIQVKAGIVYTDDALVFSYQCRQQSDDDMGVLLPTPVVPTACDNLWQHTCCEAFIGAKDAEAYLEFNFSPSGCWAVYRFDGYRVRDESYVCRFAPNIELRQLSDGFELTAKISSEVLPQTTSWLVGLTAVIETTDGQTTYWALRHDAPQPDFHLRSQFLMPLSSINQS
ncbi:MAG: hypothetical protein H6R05_329 [Burkholderiaceae bacterium]|nr:hypothetical protein [Burkholderiaceae bacterium]